MSDAFFHPISGQELPRFAGVPSFMRLPHLVPEDTRRAQVEIGLIGIPWDAGTTNRPGPRHGPRQLRDYSTMMRRVNPASGIDPFDLCNCADLGDVNPNPVDVQDTLGRITEFYAAVAAQGIVPMTGGGDHLSSLPVLRALSAAHAQPLGMVHFDAHTDRYDTYFGATATPTAPRSAARSRRAYSTPRALFRSAFAARCTMVRISSSGAPSECGSSRSRSSLTSA